jgi:predicted patatin/cPLA2 family phospholipase
MKKTGLILEGGGMRCMFTMGIVDLFMEHEITFNGTIGVSGGAAFGVNYKSKQPGRALRYNMKYAHNVGYTSWWSFLLTGNLVNAKFAYHTVPMKYDIFDKDTFKSNPMEFWLVCTNVDTGRPVYHKIEKVDYETLEWIRASSSLPVVSKIVNLDGKRLLDGGITDSIPLKFFQEQGYERNVIILTRPRSYIKEQISSIRIVDFFLRNHPNAKQAMRNRPVMYNAELEYIREQEKLGNTLVLAPDEALEIADICKDPDTMHQIYEIGRKYGETHLQEIIDFLKQ